MLKNFHPDSVKVIFDHSIKLKVQRGNVLYKQGEPAEQRVYLILAGKMTLKGFIGHLEKFDNIGSLEAGDTLGEEGVFEVPSISRKDTAYAEEEVYVLEIIKDNLDRIHNILAAGEHALDWFTLHNHLKK